MRRTLALLLGLGAAISVAAYEVSRPVVPAAPPAAPPPPASASAAPTATADAEDPPAPPPPITLDYALGPGLPPCRLEIQAGPRTEQPDRYDVGWMSRVRSLGGGCDAKDLFPDPAQKIDPDSEIPLPQGALAKPGFEGAVEKDEQPIVWLVDFDFDGYRDLVITTTMGSWNRSFLGYRFDPATHELRMEPAFAAMGSLHVDPTTRRLRANTSGGESGHSSHEYGWEKGALVELRRESTVRVMNRSGVPTGSVVEVHERRDGRLILVQRRREKL